MAGDILCECGQSGGQRGMSEVPRDGEEGDVHSANDHLCELPQEVVWPHA